MGWLRRRWLRVAVASLVLIGIAVGAGWSTLDRDTGSRTQYSSPAQIKAQRALPLTAAAAPGSIVSGPLQSPGGPYLYDRFGRVVTLHGVNAVYKHPPYELTLAPGKPWNFSAADAKEIAGLGFDVVRLGILWEGIEPGHGGPNNPAICTSGVPRNPHLFNKATADRYLAAVTRTVDLLGRYHVYTLLDMHQDVYSQAFRGEGAPAWAVCTDGQPIVPLPGRWSRNYHNPTLIIAEKHFWTNNVVGDLQGQFDHVWSVVAHHFADNPWVVGYDPYNEPFSTEQTHSGVRDFAVNLECFYTGRAHPATLIGSSTHLKCPVDDPRQGVVPTIEAADHHHLIFIEPDNYSVRHHLPSLLGPMNFPRLVYNFHSYCEARSPISGNPPDIQHCANQIFTSISRRLEERAQLSSKKQVGGPAWLMTEFGATHSVPLLDEVTRFADSVGLGWIYWSWKYYDDPTGSKDEALASPTGKLEPTANVLDRPYAQAIAGTPIYTSFEVTSDTLLVEYTSSPQISAPTVIAVPKARYYPDGYCASVIGGTVTSAPGATHLLVSATRAPRTVSVKIQPGTCSSDQE